MRSYRIYIAAIALIAVAVTVTLSAEPKPTEPPSYKYVHVRADKTRYKYGAPEVAILTGNVKITQGDAVLTADNVEYNEHEDVQTAVATGNVKIVDPEAEITGKKITAYFNERRAVVEGDVKVIAKPKQSADAKKAVRSEFKERAVITCDRIEYHYRKKEATASGNLNMVQKDRTLTAGTAFYQVRQEIITLSGGVKGRDSKGQTFSAPDSVRASIKDGSEWIEMENAVGTFRVKDEDDEEEQLTPLPTPKNGEAATE